MQSWWIGRATIRCIAECVRDQNEIPVCQEVSRRSMAAHSKPRGRAWNAFYYVLDAHAHPELRVETWLRHATS